MVSPTSLVSLWLFAGLILSMAYSSDATNLLKRPSTKGQRNKGWRRRAQNWASANESSQRGSVTSTIVTNPSTLGGKGGGGTVVYDEEDDNGRTTFVVKCKHAKALAAEETGVKAGEKIGLDPKSVLKTSGKAGGAAEAMPGIGVKAPKTVPDDICDEAPIVDASTDGGDGTWNDGGDSESQTGSGTESGTGTDNGEYQPPGTSQPVSSSVSGPPPCVDIAAGAGPFGDNKIDYNVSLDVVKQADLPSEGIMRLMRADLQYNVAPVIADCTDGSETNSNGAGDTNITDVRFNELVEDTSGCSEAWEKEATATGGACVNTIIPVEFYYNGNETADFRLRLEDAINGHQWNVPGLEKASNDNGGGLSVSAIEANQAKEDDTIGPAGYLTIAAAALVLLLLALMLVRRKRRDEMVKHVSLSDDDTYLKDIEGVSNASGSPGRLARVVGDGDSIGTGWTGAGTQFRNSDNATNGMWSGKESRPSQQDVHMCSSATCEVCERHRQSGVQFIPSATNMVHPPLSPDTPRKYGADDTVTL